MKTAVTRSFSSTASLLAALASIQLLTHCSSPSNGSGNATGGSGGSSQTGSGGALLTGGTSSSTGGENSSTGGANTSGGAVSETGGTTSGGGKAEGGNVNGGASSKGGATSGGANASAGANASGGKAGESTGGKAGESTGGKGGAAGGSAGGASAGSAGKSATGGSGGASSVAFESKTLSPDHYAEGADVGDIDGDGKLDLVAGPIWYKGPSFAVGGKLMDPVPTYKSDQYSKFFLTFVDDLDGDTYPDVIGIGDAGGANGSGTPNTYWYKNPGPANLASAWTKTALFAGLVANESPVYANLVGDARKELVFMTDRQLGYATPGATPTAAWTFKAISGSTFGTPYVHGLGVGDINGDGLADVVERSGWWQQPATSAGAWTQHTVDFGVGLTGTRSSNWGGAQMAVFDVDGDGDSDVVTALAAHQYGLSWFEQVDADHFTAHQILAPAAGGMSFSQQHSLTVGDLNGDGRPDFVTGKRYYAHPSTNPDPGTTDPPVLYWFELSRGATTTFIPHLIHSDSGAGCNFAIRDVTGDGKLDIFTTNKRGTFLHVQR
ncbi:MAG TPA: VCBS repeat-containing protein [Polyangiaceae bacterium]|jgi:hypothetical protein|nr:VCBS repeat-containing protein [Polyangiaceae bacterium]